MGNQVSEGERTTKHWVGDDRASGRGEIRGRNREGKVLGEESRRRGEAGTGPADGCVNARRNARQWQGRGLEKKEREGGGTGAGRIAGDGEGFQWEGGEAEQGSWRESSGWRWGWSVEGMMVEGWRCSGPEGAASQRGSAAWRGGGGGNNDVLVVEARSGSGSGNGGGCVYGGNGGWTPSPTFREQLLEREETPFLFSNEGWGLWGVPSPLIEPKMGREGKGPT